MARVRSVSPEVSEATKQLLESKNKKNKKKGGKLRTRMRALFFGRGDKGKEKKSRGRASSKAVEIGGVVSVRAPAAVAHQQAALIPWAPHPAGGAQVAHGHSRRRHH